MTAFDYKSEVDNSLSVKTLSKGFFREKTKKKKKFRSMSIVMSEFEALYVSQKIVAGSKYF